MVMIKDKDGIERYSISKTFLATCERCKEKMHKEDSMVLGILWGDVGSGKSLKAQHMGFAIDPTLDISRVCFDKTEYIKAIINNKKRVIIGDEGISLFFSRSSMTKEGRLMSELMDQIRQKNLCVLICVPKLLTIDWTVLDSANFVAYVWESQKVINGRKVTIKGNMAFYPSLDGDNYKVKIIEYLKKKKRSPLKPLYKPEPFFYEAGNPIGDTFKKVWYPVGRKNYLPKKESILDKFKKEETPGDKGREVQTTGKSIRKDLITQCKLNNPEWTYARIAKALGLSRQTVYTLKNEGIKQHST